MLLSADGSILTAEGKSLSAADSYLHNPPAVNMLWKTAYDNTPLGSQPGFIKNMGTDGAIYDLYPYNGGGPVVNQPNGRHSWTFDNDGWLQSYAPLDLSFCEGNSRTIGICMYTPTDTTSHTYLGYGTPNVGQQFDLFRSTGRNLFPHWYGGQLVTYQGGPNFWFTSTIRVTKLSSTSVKLEEFYNDNLYNTLTLDNTLNTTQTKFYLGGGVFPTGNPAGLRSISGAYVTNQALTNEEVFAMHRYLMEF